MTEGDDVIVVGGRCAGSPLAMLLARRGHSVRLIERAVFPKDTISTLLIHRPGVALLHEWGLLDRLTATGCPALERMHWNLDGLDLRGAPPVHAGAATTYAPRRSVLDRILFEAAAEAGADVAEGVVVDDVVWSDGRVIGVRARGRSGDALEMRARLVVGADGVFSTVARRVRAPIDREGPKTSSSYYAIYDAPGPRDEVQLIAGDGVGAGLIPTHEGHTLVAVSWARERAAEARRDLAGGFQRTAMSLPALAERLAAGKQLERIVGRRDFSNWMRRSHGPGWALVGDAGYSKDAITAQGITDAFRSAQALADAIDAGLRGERDLDGALADYQRQRDDFGTPFFEWTIDNARLRPLQPRTRALFKSISTSEQATTDFFGINAELTNPREFFAPEHAALLLGAVH